MHKLVYYEVFDNINDAIEREKQIKSKNRQRKIDLVSNKNLAWKDLSNKLRDCHASLAMTRKNEIATLAMTSTIELCRFMYNGH